MGLAGGPQHVSQALSELIALRGLARARGNEQLHALWSDVAGEKIAAQTRVLGVKRGVLQVGVSNPSLLSELVSFHRGSLLESLQRDHAHLQLRDLKFRLNSEPGK